jgi:hypothetical protein
MTMTMEPSLKRHPIRGFVWGLVLGLGVALILVNFAVIALGTLTPWVITLAFAVLGVLWGLFAPAKTKGTPPMATAPPVTPGAPPSGPPPGPPPTPGAPPSATSF